MFWSEYELEELKGTGVVGLSCYFMRCCGTCSTGMGEVLILWIIDKIGRQDAECAYHESLIPAVTVCLCCSTSWPRCSQIILLC